MKILKSKLFINSIFAIIFLFIYFCCPIATHYRYGDFTVNESFIDLINVSSDIMVLLSFIIIEYVIIVVLSLNLDKKGRITGIIMLIIQIIVETLYLLVISSADRFQLNFFGIVMLLDTIICLVYNCIKKDKKINNIVDKVKEFKIDNKSNIDKIKEYKELLDMGAITKKEFDEMKTAILKNDLEKINKE